ncbi:MAG: energy transducer TonB [Bacteroidia bacterium]
MIRTYRIFSLAILFALFSGSLTAQNSRGAASDTVKVKKPAEVGVTEETDEPEVFVFVEEMPEFPGGTDSMARFIGAHLNYPDSAVENSIQGKVMVQFVIDEEGRVTDPKIVKGLGWGCDEEVLRIVRLMPNWIPGKQKGKPVKIRFVLPIKFQLS